MSVKIEYNHRCGKYMAGEIVSGKIIIKNDTPIEVTGLKITMFMRCKLVLSKDANGKLKLIDFTEEIFHQILNHHLFSDFKFKSRVFPAGSHSFPFMFLPLHKDFPPSCESEHTFCRYFLQAEMEQKAKDTVVAKKEFRVRALPLDDNPAAHKWQTKFDSKYIKMSLKKVSMEVTVPNAIGRNEGVPIHLRIHNDSKNPKIIIRSRLIQIRNLPSQTDFPKEERTKIANDYVEELDVVNSEITTFLKVNAGVSFSGPIVSESYKIQVEVETAKSTLLKVQFPVIVGQWKNGPVREIIGTKEVFNEETRESRQQLLNYLLNTIVEMNSASPSAPPISPVTAAPTAPDMDGYGILPPLSGGAGENPQHPLQTAPQPRSVKALYAFTGDHSSELSFNIGQIITNVYQSNEDGWMFGTVNGNTGMFPFSFVEPIASN